MADLQEVFTRLRASAADSPSGHSQSSTAVDRSSSSLWAQPPAYQAPSVSSPLFSPHIATPNPTHASSILSPAPLASNTATPGPDQQRTNNLLNLLKFNQAAGQQAHGSTGAMANLQNVGVSRSTSSHVPNILRRDSDASRPLSASDLVATLQNKSSDAAPTLPSFENTTARTSSSQDVLLNLFKPKAHPILSKTDEKNAEPIKAQGVTPTRHFGSPAASETTFEAPQPIKATKFNYKNPFDELHSSSPLKSSSPHSQPGADNTAKFEIIKHSRDTSTTREATVQPIMKSRKVGHEAVGSNDDSTFTPTGKSSSKSVSEAFRDVSKTVDRQAETALAETEAKEIAQNSTPTAHHPKVPTSKTGVKKDDNEDIASSWESADDDLNPEFKVEVYNFPMKPFVSIQIENMPVARPIRQDNFMIIAQLKKEFDQIDRCLVTASESHIVYAQVASKRENGGFRIIRQDNGHHKHVFRTTGERIFSVQLCTTAMPGDDVETVLGTGVNGSILWTSLAKSSGDLFDDDDVEAQGFIMPPVATPEENTSGSPIKTRAKMSSRHPDFFGVARGKQIFIISPDTVKGSEYCNQITRTVDTEKYLQDHTLKICTGKAGKDFCFSEDDTVIVSLDKIGRFKFWDIRELTARASDIEETKHEPIELNEPLWTMNAAASGSKADEKPSVSSIMFLDKEKPTVKGHALRYMIIGFKQNHILQLWDLGLGKAVQELRLPHEKDSDGICSISYHSKSGIIAVGHPTRNSIYFIHLSAPKYTGPYSGRDQAEYIRMLARGDRAIPKPDSTAIMSGLREFSFAKVGQLRSIDMLKTPIENASKAGTPDETLFELYAMHSKGIVGISIKRDDLGWDASSKMVAPKNAQAEGVVSISELIQPHKSMASSDQNGTTEGTSRQTKSVKKEEPTKLPDLSKSVATPTRIQTKENEQDVPAPTNGTGHAEVTDGNTPNTGSGLPALADAERINGRHTTASKAVTVPKETQITRSPVKEQPAQAPVDLPSQLAGSAPKEAAKPDTNSDQMQSFVTAEFAKLYERIEAGMRARDAEFNARQDVLLRLVSSTLTDNVERSLTDIVSKKIQQDVLPAIERHTVQEMTRTLGDLLPREVSSNVRSAIDARLPGFLRQVYEDETLQRSIAEMSMAQVASNISHQVSAALDSHRIAVETMQKTSNDLVSSTNMQLRRAEEQHAQDRARIDELTSAMNSMMQMVKGVANAQQGLNESQAAMHEALTRMKEARPVPSQEQALPLTANATSEEQRGPAEQYELDAQEQLQLDGEVDRLTKLLVNGDWQDATLSWIGNKYQVELFDKLFIRVNMDYLHQLEPLVMLTVSVAITSSLDTNVDERLEWLSRIIDSVDTRHSDVHDVAPKIMDVLLQRLQGARLAFSEGRQSRPATLKAMDKITAQMSEVRRLTA